MCSASAALLLLVGCVSDKHPPRPSPPVVAGPVDQLNLLTASFAVDFDGLPGPDGIGVKLYATSGSQPASVPIQNGNLEVLMYDGLIPERAAPTNAPLHTWKFSADQLKPYELSSAVGVLYQLALPWGNDKPTKNRVTVLARYMAPAGTIMASARSVIAVGK